LQRGVQQRLGPQLAGHHAGRDAGRVVLDERLAGFVDRVHAAGFMPLASCR
jgi:hypothetical protein